MIDDSFSLHHVVDRTFLRILSLQNLKYTVYTYLSNLLEDQTNVFVNPPECSAYHSVFGTPRFALISRFVGYAINVSFLQPMNFKG